LPADLVVYCVIAWAIFMQKNYEEEVLRGVLEGFQWLASSDSPVKIAGHSGILQARNRLAVALAGSRGASYRD